MLPVVKEEFAILPSIFPTRQELGLQAAHDVAAELRRKLAAQPRVRVIFAAAPSQSEMLHALAQSPSIEWSRVEAFHMDEYLGLPSDSPQRFSHFLQQGIFNRVPFAAVHLLNPSSDPGATARQYAAALAEAPIDIVCCGIGSNAHLAFNDPPADFDDPQDVKIVGLDTDCRQQQVDDLCFTTIDQVPTHAITLTVPRLLRADAIFCCVPGAFKSQAVRATLQGPITEDCPASALRLHPNCKLYLDIDSAAALKP